MNIWKFEIRRSRGSLFGWTMGLLAMVFVFMVGMFPIYRDSIQDVMDLMNAFPKAFLEIFGMNDAIFSYGGFFAFACNFLILVGVMFSGTVTLSVFTREKRNGCQEFLFTKPVARKGIFLEKLFAVLTVLLISNLLLVAFTALVTSMAGETEVLGNVVLASLSVFLTQLVLMPVMILYAASARKVRTVAAPAMAFAFGGYILTALSGLIDKEEIRFVAPYRYFDPLKAATEGGFEPVYGVTGIVVFVVFMALSFLVFTRKDIRA